MKDPVLQLLRAIRGRLWLARARRAAVLAAWALALAALAVGAVHQWLIAVPMATALTLIPLPAAITLIACLARRPPALDDCARRADRLLAAQDLITSAWEISIRPGPEQRAAALVRQRAAAVAADSLPQLRTLLPAASRPAILPLALALAGAFLVVNPGAERPVASDRAGVDPAGETTATASETLAATGAATQPSERRERPTVAREGIVLPDPLEKDDGPTPLLVPDVSRPGADGGSEELGKLAADGRPTARLAGEVGLADIEVRIVSVDTIAAAADTTAGTAGAELDATAGPAGESSTGARALARPGTLADWNRLTAPERRLAERYFELVSPGNENQ